MGKDDPPLPQIMVTSMLSPRPPPLVPSKSQRLGTLVHSFSVCFSLGLDMYGGLG